MAASTTATTAASTTGGVRPCVLIILDGWGIAPPGPENAIEAAQTQHLDHYRQQWPYATLAASGLSLLANSLILIALAMA